MKMNLIMVKILKTNINLSEEEKIRIKSLAARRKVFIFADTKLYRFDWDSHQLLLNAENATLADGVPICIAFVM